MNFGELIEQTAARLIVDRVQDIRGFRSSANTFLRLAGLSTESECTNDYLSDEHVQRVRSNGEASGALAKGGSAAWSSRVKQLVVTWQRIQARNEGTTFNALLGQAMKETGESIIAVATATGMSKHVLRDWVAGKSPAECNRSAIARLDAYFKLGGRLVASLAGVKLHSRPVAKVYSAEERDEILAGKADLHATTRFFAAEADVYLTELARAAGMRATLLRWIQGATGLRKVALRTSDGPAFLALDASTKAGGVVYAVFQRHLACRVSDDKLMFTLPNWPAGLKADYERLCAYKTVNPTGLDRSERARWITYTMPDGTRFTPTEETWRSTFEYVFGYALRSGAVARSEDLRLAHMTVVELVTGFLLERMERRQRDHLNTSDRTALRVFYSLTWGGGEDGGGCGYFANDSIGVEYWADPYFATRLPTQWLPISAGGYRIASEPIIIPREKWANRWQAYLAEVNKRIGKFERGHDFIKGDYAESVRDILANPDFDVGKWLREGFQRLLTNVPPRGSAPQRWAQHVRKCVLYLFMCTRGFRRSTHARLEMKHIEWNVTTGVYMYHIPAELTKMRGKGGSKGGVHAAVDDVLGDFDRRPAGMAALPDNATALLDVFIKEARPLLGIENNSFYGWASGDGVYEAFTALCLEALGREIPPHAFRYLIATWCKRTGIPVEQAAAILIHLPGATQEIYDKTNAIDVGRSTNAAVRRLFGRPAA